MKAKRKSTRTRWIDWARIGLAGGPVRERLQGAARAPALLVALLLCATIAHHPQRLATSVVDAFLRLEPKQAPADVRLVVIDDGDYGALFESRSPLHPDTLDHLLEAIAQARPSAIVVDLDTSDPSFASFAAPAVPVVWLCGRAGGAASEDGPVRVSPSLAYNPGDPRQSIALADFTRDDTGVVRAYRDTYRSMAAGVSIASPAAATAALLNRRAIGTGPGDTRALALRYRFEPLSAGTVTERAQDSHWAAGRAFEGQVVVLGGVYRAARDNLATAEGLAPGAELVAQTIQAELDGRAFATAALNRFAMVVGLLGLIVFLMRAFGPSGGRGWRRRRVFWLVYAMAAAVLGLAAQTMFHLGGESFVQHWCLACVVIGIEWFALAEIVTGLLEIGESLERWLRSRPPHPAGAANRQN